MAATLIVKRPDGSLTSFGPEYQVPEEHMSDDSGKGDDSGKLLYCSFCGKSQHEVRKLIAGPSVFICDECVELCNDIIREEVSEATQTGESSKLPVPQEIKTILNWARARRRCRSRPGATRS